MRYRILLFVIVAAITFALDALALFVAWTHNQRAEQAATHARVVINNLTSIIAHVRTSESAARGYLNTEDTAFLRPYYQAESATFEKLDAQEEVAAHSEKEQALREKMRQAITEKMNWQKELIFVCQHNGREKAVALSRTRRGMNLMSDIDSLTQQMKTEETDLLLGETYRCKWYRSAMLLAVGLLTFIGCCALYQMVRLERYSGKIEKQRAETYDRLEEANEDLNRQLCDLLKAKEDLNHALHARSEFIATVSHELRTPLAGTLGAVELVLDSSLTPEQKDLMTTARECALKSLVQINDLLDFESIEQKDFELEIAPFSIKDLVQSVFASLSLKAQSKGLTARLELSETLPGSVLGDATRIRQILNNLVDNAIRFTEHGTVSITVTALPASSDCIPVLFAIADTGAGVPSEYIERIYEPFVQVDSSTTRRHDGMGMGLALARKLVELMNGKIELSSELDKGSTFFVTIPFLKGASDSSTESSLPKEQETFPILLVDSSRTMQLIYRQQLRRLGYSVELASDAFGAIKLAHSRRYGLIVFDSRARGLDGVLAIRKIRGDQSNPLCEAPIVAMSPHLEPREEKSYRSAPAIMLRNLPH